MNRRQLLFSFDGRVGRGVHRGLAVVVIVLFCVLAGVVFTTTDMSNPPAGTGIGGILVGLVGLAIIWPAPAIQASAGTMSTNLAGGS